MKRTIPALFAAITTLAASGCGDDESSDSAGDASTDTVTDTGTDSDSDTDSDADTDADTDPLDCAGGRYDVNTAMCWQDPMTDNMTWQEAADYCDVLDLGDRSDWRLPNHYDFSGLLGGCSAEVAEGGDGGGCHTCMQSGSCAAMFGLDGYSYWSSSTCADDDETAQVFSFHNGEVGCLGKTCGFHVRCVRLMSEVDAGLDGGK